MWQKSIELLSEIVGERIRLASVPGGYYSFEVARAAVAVGIDALFTSEPTTAVHHVDGCRIFGRYLIKRNVSAATAGSLVSGARLPRYRQFIAWNTFKLAKTVGGPAYPRIRRLLLNARS